MSASKSGYFVNKIKREGGGNVETRMNYVGSQCDRSSIGIIN